MFTSEQLLNIRKTTEMHLHVFSLFFVFEVLSLPHKNRFA